MKLYILGNGTLNFISFSIHTKKKIGRPHEIVQI
jgi:hypothetical protein